MLLKIKEKRAIKGLMNNQKEAKILEKNQKQRNEGLLAKRKVLLQAKPGLLKKQMLTEEQIPLKVLLLNRKQIISQGVKKIKKVHLKALKTKQKKQAAKKRQVPAELMSLSFLKLKMGEVDLQQHLNFL